MRRALIVTLACSASLIAAADAPPLVVPDGLALRAWAATDAVLARSIDPPTRQGMLLAGTKAVHKAAGVSTPPDLARRVSSLASPDQFVALLADAWPWRIVAINIKTNGSDRTVGERDLEAALIDGLLAGVPGEAELIAARDLKVAEQVAGNLYVGVQIALGPDGVIAQVLEGGPADKAGAKDKDQIEAIDGVDIKGMPLKDVVDRLRGELGTDVVVRLRRPDVAEPLTRTMTRGILPRKTVEGLRRRDDGHWDVVFDGPDPIGYLKLLEVVGSTPRELRDWSRQLEAAGARALVLDLRQVSHSDLHSAVLLADALLDGGTIGRVRSVDGEEVFRAEPDALFRGLPLALVIEATAPGEVRWLCAGLEDNKRAAVIGLLDDLPAEVRSAVALPGGEWSVLMATGRLERGDGRPLGPTSTTPSRFDPTTRVTTRPAPAAGDYQPRPAAVELENALDRSLHTSNSLKLNPALPKASDPIAQARATLTQALHAAKP